MNELLFHPIASVLPMMPISEIKELAEDIKTNGQREPIILLDDMVLDGRNRYEACKIAGTNPRYEKFTGENPIAYVLSLNVKRRHLTASQKAAVAVEAEPFFAEEAKQRMEKGRPKEGVGKIPQVTAKARDQAAAPSSSAATCCTTPTSGTPTCICRLCLAATRSPTRSWPSISTPR